MSEWITKGFELFREGGPIMYPILICLVLTITVIIERGWSLRRVNVIPRGLVEEVNSLIRSGHHEEALAAARRSLSPMGRIFEAAIDAGMSDNRKGENIQEGVEASGKAEARELMRYMGMLGAIAGISPLLGLLGTVTGMIRSFNVIAKLGAANPHVLATHISEALLTTAFGLTVAIPAFIAHRYYQARADAFVAEMEFAAQRLVSGMGKIEEEVKG